VAQRWKESEIQDFVGYGAGVFTFAGLYLFPDEGWKEVTRKHKKEERHENLTPPLILPYRGGN
jgi:hypothetical protein